MFKVISKLIPFCAIMFFYASPALALQSINESGGLTTIAEDVSKVCLSKVDFVSHIIGLRYAKVTQDEAMVTVAVTEKIMKYVNPKNENQITREKMEDVVVMVWSIPDEHLHDREFINQIIKAVFNQCVKNNSDINT